MQASHILFNLIERLHCETGELNFYYRDKKEVEPWEKRCPIRRFELYLKNKGYLTPESMLEITESCDQEVLAARDTFYNMPSANPGEIFDHLYECMPEELKHQRDEYRKRLDDKGG